MVFATAASAALLAVSAAARTSLRQWLASPAGIFSMITVFAAAMSLGPEIRAKGRVVADTSLYSGVLRLRAGLRWCARAGALRHDRVARPRGAGRPGNQSSVSRRQWAVGSRRCGDERRRSALCERHRRRAHRARGDGHADPHQPELHRIRAGGPRAAAAIRRDRRRRRRSIASSPRFRRHRSSSSCRWASRRSTCATCSIRRSIGSGSSTGTAAARHNSTSSSGRR